MLIDLGHPFVGRVFAILLSISRLRMSYYVFSIFFYPCGALLFFLKIIFCSLSLCGTLLDDEISLGVDDFYDACDDVGVAFAGKIRMNEGLGMEGTGGCW